MRNVGAMKKEGEAEKNYPTETRRYRFIVLRKDTGEETAEKQRSSKTLAFRTLAVL